MPFEPQAPSDYDMRMPSLRPRQEAPEGSVWGAAAREVNTIVSSYNYLAERTGFAYDPEHNPLDLIKDTHYEATHLDRFVGSFSAGETIARMQRIDREENDRKILAAGGFEGFIAQAAMGIADPTILLPGGVIYRGAKLGHAVSKSALAGSASIGAMVASQEAILYGTHELRTGMESTTSIAVGTILGGILGGAVSYMGSRELARATRGLEALRKETTADFSGIPPGGGARGAGAAGAEREGLTLAPAFASERVADLFPSTRMLGVDRFSPVTRLQQSPFNAARAMVRDLSDAGLSYVENKLGEITSRLGTIETRVKMWRGAEFEFYEQLDNAYAKYAFDTTDPGMWDKLRVRAGWASVISKRGGKFTREEFNEEVAMTARNPSEPHPIPHVNDAAKAFRELDDKLKNAAIDAEIPNFSDDMKVLGAEAHVMRVYNRQKIIAHRHGPPNSATGEMSWTDILMQNATKQHEAAVAAFDARKAKKVSALETEAADLATTAATRPALVRQLEADAVRVRSENPSLVALDQHLKELRAREAVAKKAGNTEEAAALRAEEKEARAAGGAEFAAYVSERNKIAARLARLKRTAPIEDKPTLAPKVTGFTTDRGSTYAVQSDGTTIRNKAARADPGHEGQSGIQPKSQRTVYVSADDAQKLAEFQIEGGPKRAVTVTSDGRLGVKYLEGKDAGKFEKRTVIPFEKQPQVGAIPVEMWDKGARVHFGNKITEIAEAAPTARGVRSAQVAIHDASQKAALAEARKPLDEALADLARVRDEGLAQAKATYEAGRDGVTRRQQQALAAELRKTERRLSELHDRAVKAKEKEFAPGLRQFVKEQAAARKAFVKGLGQAEQTASRIADLQDRAANVRSETPTGLAGISGEAELRALVNDTTHTILGESAIRIPGLTLARGPQGALKRRILNIPDHVIAPYLENDIEKIARTTVRSMAGDIEVADRFGDVNMSEGLQRLVEEHAAKQLAATTPKQRKRLQTRFERDMKDLELLRDRARGFDLMPDNPDGWLYRGGRLALNSNYIAKLGMQTWSSGADIARPIMRYGLNSTFQDGWLPFITNLNAMKSVLRELNLSGTALDLIRDQRTMHLADLMDDFGRHSKPERAVQWAADKFSMVSMMAPWNAIGKWIAGSVTMANVLRATKAVVDLDTLRAANPAHAARDAAVRELQSRAAKARAVGRGDEYKALQAEAKASVAAGGADYAKFAAVSAATQKQIARLAEDGIDEAMAARIWANTTQFGEQSGRMWVPNTEKWRNAAGVLDHEAVEAFRAALNREVETLISSQGLEKPRWTSYAVGKVVGQFKTFSLITTQRTLLAGLQQRDAAILQGVLASMALGALVAKAKNEFRGDRAEDTSRWTQGKWVVEALDNSGLMGVFMEANNMTEKVTGGGLGLSLVSGKQVSRYASRNKIGALLGPTADAFADATTIGRLIDFRTDGKSNKWSAADTHAMRKIIPLQNLFYIRQLFDMAERGVNRQFNIPAQRPRR